jgi:DNA polymerase III alpha subunit (gram-positive type)
MQQEIFISVDVETDGMVPGDFSMTEIGAVVVGKPEQSFEAYLRPISERVIPAAAVVGKKNRKWLMENGEDPATVMMRFAEWVKSCVPDGARPVFIGYNAAFDWMFVHWYFIHFIGENPFGYSALDIKSYYAGLAHVESWADTGMKKLPPEYAPTRELSHSAKDAALQQAEIFEKMRMVSSKSDK